MGWTVISALYSGHALLLMYALYGFLPGYKNPKESVTMRTCIIADEFNLRIPRQLTEVSSEEGDEGLLGHVLPPIVGHLIRHLEGPIDDPHDRNQQDPGNGQSKDGLQEEDSPPGPPDQSSPLVIAGRVSHSARFQRFAHATYGPPTRSR